MLEQSSFLKHADTWHSTMHCAGKMLVGKIISVYQDNVKFTQQEKKRETMDICCIFRNEITSDQCFL